MGVVRAELDSISSGQVRQALGKYAYLVAAGRLRRGKSTTTRLRVGGVAHRPPRPHSATPPRRRMRG